MGKNAQNSDSIQLLENNKLVTDSGQVGSIFKSTLNHLNETKQ